MATQETIDIVFDGPPAHESGRFVEVEDMTGKSINVGQWVQRTNGLWALRIPDPRRLAAAEALLQNCGTCGRAFADSCGGPVCYVHLVCIDHALWEPKR